MPAEPGAPRRPNAAAGPPDPAAAAGPPDPVAPAAGRSGLDVARAALAAARAAARERGLRPGVPAPSSRRSASPRSGAYPDDRDPQLLGATLDRLAADRGWETELAVGAVLGRWERIVGAEVAAHCVPETFHDGSLLVRADSTAWATQVRLLSSTLLARLAEEVGPGTVTTVRVVGPDAPSWRRGRLRVAGRGPRDTYG